MKPLELMFERPGLPAFAIGPELAAVYGGDLGFGAPRVYANFVASVDGVVTLRQGDESGHHISGDSDADRFVMGLLRATADAVLIGAGTFRHAPGHRWHAEAIHPALAEPFADLRRRLGLAPHPRLVVASASGAIDPAQPALDDALIVTTDAGAARLRGRLPGGAELALLDAPIRAADLMALVRDRGFRAVLTEGGPSLVAELAAARLLDELFLTSAPALYGRLPGDGRKSLIDGADLARAPLELWSARRSGSHLFLRYALAR